MSKNHELLDDIQEQITHKLIALSIVKEDAVEAAKHVRNLIVNHWGGQQLYIPKVEINKARDKEIIDKFNGTNQPELAKEYGMSMRQVYRLLKSHHEKKAPTIKNN